MSSLLWKEWHEQAWKLGFGCVVLGALALIGLRARIIADETMVMWVCFLGLTLLPVLSSTGLLPAERSEGVFESLIALPVSPRRILLAKTLLGLLLCAGPMIVALILSLLVGGGREMTSGEMISLYARSTGATLSLFIWMLALTSRLPSEARAGLIGLGILIFWILGTIGLTESPGGSPLLMAISPLAFVYQYAAGNSAGPKMLIVTAVQLAIAALLWIWTSRRLLGVSEGQP